MKTLKDALDCLTKIHNKDTNTIVLAKDHYSPGYVCALAAFVVANKITEDNFNAAEENMSYLRTMNFHHVVWDTLDGIHRGKSGSTYSPLTALYRPDDVDRATTTINNCIRELVSNITCQGIRALYDVVGELHDNVWSHANALAYSMAQRTAVPNTNRNDYFIEFAVVDNGIGFLKELNRAKQKVNSDREAIEWCIREGNSTKHADQLDDWSQRLPEDHVGDNPMGAFATPMPENHHQGLGLTHLIDLIKNYNGELQLCSGSALFQINRTGEESYQNILNHWQGVAISCKLRESSLVNSVEKDTAKELRQQTIMQRLRGSTR